MYRRCRILVFALLGLNLIVSAHAQTSRPEQEPASGDESHNSEKAPEAAKVVDAYFAALQANDMDRASALFLPDGASHILENGKAEGSWETYLEHHLKPEMEATHSALEKECRGVAKEEEKE